MNQHSDSPTTDTTEDSSCCAPTCCSEETSATDQASSTGAVATQDPTTMSPNDLRNTVREKYGAIANAERGGCGCGTADMENLGYSNDQAGTVPEGADLGLGCGNPLQHAAVQPGETILDLGSGAGIDAFLAAKEVGASGRVIGVDMTSAMLDRARTNAERIDASNVEFRLGEIEHLPVADNAVDLIISNCVINLSPDKSQVFAEARRVLRPGGRLVVSDLVVLQELPADILSSISAYIGCVAGASRREDYLQAIRDAGFEKVEVVEEKRYAGADGIPEGNATLTRALEWSGKNVVSMKVRAFKPQQ
jgi:arsenite methyltransferase